MNYEEILEGNFISPLIEAIDMKISSQPSFLKNEGEHILNIIKNSPIQNRLELTNYIADCGANFATRSEGVINQNFLEDIFNFEDNIACKLFNLATSKTLNETKKSQDITLFIGELILRGYSQTLSVLKDEFWLINKINIFSDEINVGSTTEKVRDYWFGKLILNATTIKEYSELSYSSTDRTAIELVEHEIRNSKKINIAKITHLIEATKDLISDETKEYIVANTLVNTSDQKLLKSALKTYGLNEFKLNVPIDYKPLNYPIWVFSQEHKDKDIYEKFLGVGVDAYDYSIKTNETFLKLLLEKFSNDEAKLKELNLMPEFLKNNIFKPHKDIPNFTNYDLISMSGNTKLYDHLNINLNDYKKHFPDLDLSDTKSIGGVLSQTLLKRTSRKALHEQNNDTEIDDLTSNVVRQIINSSSLIEPDELMELHLDLLNASDNSDYSDKYFDVLKELIMTYSFATVEEGTKYSNFIDKLFQNALIINPKIDDAAKELQLIIDDPKRKYIHDLSTSYHKKICSEISSIVLHNELTSNLSVKRRIKI